MVVVVSARWGRGSALCRIVGHEAAPVFWSLIQSNLVALPFEPGDLGFDKLEIGVTEKGLRTTIGLIPAPRSQLTQPVEQLHEARVDIAELRPFVDAALDGAVGLHRLLKHVMQE